MIAPHLMSNDTQQVQSVRMVRLGRQHAPVTRLGLGQSSRLVICDGRPEELGATRCRHGGCGFLRIS